MTPARLTPIANVPAQTTDALMTEALGYAARAKAPATIKAYRTDWADFTTWCADLGRSPLPATLETVALFLTARAQAGLRVATIERRLAAITAAHRAAGVPAPSRRDEPLHSVWQGIRRMHGKPQRQVAPAETAEIRAMAATCDDSLIGRRDRAFLLIGFAGALRRSELVGLDMADVDLRREGLMVTIRRSKTDQESHGEEIGIPYGSHPATCPVRAWQDWLEASGFRKGAAWHPITRHGHIQPGRLSAAAVAEIVKRRAATAGLDPDRYAGHSLRAGFATAAAAAGVQEANIARQTRHRSVATLRRYVRLGSVWRDNPAASIGL